jgi:hypothetical protein
MTTKTKSVFKYIICKHIEFLGDPMIITEYILSDFCVLFVVDFIIGTALLTLFYLYYIEFLGDPMIVTICPMHFALFSCLPSAGHHFWCLALRVFFAFLFCWRKVPRRQAQMADTWHVVCFMLNLRHFL